jgi:cysteinyl-tRNA synthetase
MILKLYNTLGRKKQEFKPIKKGQVGMYSCGPTVYNYAHIGNLRNYVFNDLLKRTLLYNGLKVKQVMNMTDVDDKTIRGAKNENISLKELTRKYEQIFLRDLEELNILKPEVICRATEHIHDMVELIKILMNKKYAYKAEDGIYFSVSKFKTYGKLANLKNSKSKKSRIKNDEYDKDNIQDFALWKFWSEEDGEIFWETEIGKGRPGWHIECSAMSSKYLGQPFDIHTGAIDLIFPHHTNEIAQSEAATGKKFVNYWIHGGFLTMKEGKMAKSLGNVYVLSDLKKKGYSALDYRYLLLTSHYRSPLLFSFESLGNAQNSYKRLKNIISEIKDDPKENKEYLKEFEKAMNDDLNTPEALQVLWKLVRDEKAEGKIKTIGKMDEVFGLDLLKQEKIKVSAEVQKLVDEREKARADKDWKKADELRNKIKDLGYQVSDTENGAKITKLL